MKELKVLFLFLWFLVILPSTAIANDSEKNSFSLLINTKAVDVEIRRALWKHLEVSASWFADKELFNIQGETITRAAAAEVWAVSRFFNDRIKLGVGGGPHYNNMSTSEGGPPRGVSSVISLMAGCQIKDSSPWSLVVYGDRINYKDHSAKNEWRAGLSYKF